MARLFGTDGVRGVANADLTPELALRVSRAGAQVIARDIDPALPIVVGRDTRLSSPMLEAAVVAGVASAGRGVLTIGIVPTPGVACIVTAIDAAAGVMISASHNPIEDNGIKFFGPDGFKLADDVEREIEALLDDDLTERPTHADVGSIRSAVGLVDRYATRLIEAGGDLSGLTVVVDAAYGAAYRVAPRVLERLGARVVALHDEPDGARINVNCGTTDLRALAARVSALSAAEPAAQVVGVAFDGDADRALFVDERGNALSGDNVMLILGRELHAEGRLAGGTVVGTVMSNLGLVEGLARRGIGFVRVAVGDRYVLEAMRAGGYSFGGEQSGHIIDLTRNTTGDGPMTAVSLLSTLARTGARLADLAADFVVYPQRLLNVRVRRKDGLADHPAVFAAIVDAERELGEHGRVLVRPSGTEPVVRVMVEGPDDEQIDRLARCVARAIEGAAM